MGSIIDSDFTPGARTINGVNLGSTQLGFAIRQGSGAPIQVSISGQLASASNPGAGWTPLAAAATAGGYDLYWRNSVSGQYARWNLNSSGAFIGGEALTLNQFLQAETSLNADLDGDGSTGLLYTAGARTINGVNLGSTQLGFAIRQGSGAPIQVSISGQFTSASNPGAGWTPLAAAATAGGYDLYWRNSVSGQLARWNLDSTGAFVGGGVLSPNQFLQAETSLNADLDGDGSTGLLYTAGARTINGVNLGS
ncbi:protease, partial [Cyanobium sp. Copco_Reservoir_LC18]